MNDQPSAPAPDRSAIVQVAAALIRAGYYGLRELKVSEQGGAIVLEGRLSTYYMKQMAQEAAMAVDGVNRIENHIEVV